MENYISLIHKNCSDYFDWVIKNLDIEFDNENLENIFSTSMK